MDKRRKLLAFAYKCLIVASLAALFAITGNSLGQTDPGNSHYADFLGYYRSAKIVLSEDRSRIYDRELQLKYFNSLGAAQQSTEFIYSQNPPFFFLLLAPFALLPLNLSFKLWIALSVLSTLAAVYLLLKVLHETKTSTAIFYTSAALLSAPGWICIAVGQMSWFMTALFALFFWAIRARKDLFCGIVLALSTSKFQYVFIMATALLGRRQWKALAYALLSELILLGGSAAVIGLNNVINYPLLLMNAETTRDYAGVFPEYMISLRGVFSLFFDRHAALLSSSILMFAGLLPLTMLWWQEKRLESRQSFAWASAITICAALLLSAHTHIYDDLLLLIAAAATLPMIHHLNSIDGDLSSGTTHGVAAKLWSAALLSFPFLSWMLLVTCNNVDALRRTPFAFLNLMLLMCALHMFFQKNLNKQKGDA